MHSLLSWYSISQPSLSKCRSPILNGRNITHRHIIIVAHLYTLMKYIASTILFLGKLQQHLIRKILAHIVICIM